MDDELRLLIRLSLVTNEDLLDQLRDLTSIDARAPVHGHLIAASDNQITEASEKAIEEEV